MSKTVTYSKQVVHRDFLEMLANASNYSGIADAKPSNTTELKELLESINSELTPSILLEVTGAYEITFNAATIQNPNTGRKRTISSAPDFTSGTVTIPPASGGTIVVSPGTNIPAFTVSANSYRKISFEIDGAGDIVVTLGVEGASEAAATLPPVNGSNSPIGYFVVRTDFASQIEEVSVDYLYQFKDASSANIPLATPAVTGLMGTGAQSFGGDKTFQGLVSFGDGTAGAPSMRFESDPNTGFYATGNNGIIEWSGNSSSGGFLHSGGVRTVNGSQGNPSYSFTNGDSTGLYYTTNAINFSTNGVFRGGFTSQGLRLQSGSVGSPSLYFEQEGSANTGWYFATDGSWNFASNGSFGVRLANDFIEIGDGTNSTSTLRIRASTTSRVQFANDDEGEIRYDHSGNDMIFRADDSDVLTIHSNGQVQCMGAGSETVPSIYFGTTLTTGFYNGGSGGVIKWTGNGVDGGYLWNNGIRVSDGTADNPSLGFRDDVNMGFYMPTNNVLGVSIANVERYRFLYDSFRPTANNTVDLGTNSYAFGDVYGVNAYTITSDATKKEQVVDSDLGLEFLNKLRPVSYKWIDGTRRHYGLIAQEVKQVLDDSNISTEDFGAYVDGSVNSEDGSGLALRYTELISPMIKAIQELSQRLEALENA